MFNPCIVIPVYDHEQSLPGVLDEIKPHALPCILVDDGSSAACRKTLDRLAARAPDFRYLVRHERNQGKGAAVMTGFRFAAAHGYTHVLQIDADGQHRPQDIPEFMAAAQQFPTAVIVGVPVFDASIPKIRRVARHLTHVWVWISTLSLDIKDSMCGFRVYPLAPVLELMRRVKLGERMEFDIEILVRMHWAGTPFVNVSTEVKYPHDGVSHFKIWHDNLRISGLHARLSLGMLKRLPSRILRRPKHP